MKSIGQDVKDLNIGLEVLGIFKRLKKIEEDAAKVVMSGGAGISSGGATTFLGLNDTPNTYVGQAGKGVRVNAGETGLEFYIAVDTDEKLKVSANDSTAGYLNGKLVQGTGISLTENNNGADETLEIACTITQYTDAMAVAATAGSYSVLGHMHDHGTLTGLLDDDHSQYALLAGRAGGQTVYGDTASGGNLTLGSTAHATKGKILFGTSAYDEVNNRLGIGTNAPYCPLQIKVAGAPTISLDNSNVSIPDLSNNYVIGANTIGQITSVSTTKGGLQFLGVDATDSGAQALLFNAVSGNRTPGSAAPLVFRASRWNGANGIEVLTNTTTAIAFQNFGTELLSFKGGGQATQTVTLNQATGNEVAYTLNYTTNKLTSGNDTGLKISMTDTASPGTSYPLAIYTGAAGDTAVWNCNETGTQNCKAVILPGGSGSYYRIGEFFLSAAVLFYANKNNEVWAMSTNFDLANKTGFYCSYGTYSMASGTNYVVRFDPTMTQTGGTNKVLALTPTYNQASGTAANTDFEIKRTEIAVGSGAQYFTNFLVGATSYYSVNNVGLVTAASHYQTATSIYRRYYHVPLSAINPGASGATWTPATANNLSGWQLNAAGELLYFGSDVHADWDGASDITVEISFALLSAGSAGDTVDLRLQCFYAGTGDTATKTQTIEVPTTTDGTQYKIYKATFTIDYDAVSNVVDARDKFSFILNLETDTSEIDNILVTNGSYYYNTKHVGIEDSDT